MCANTFQVDVLNRVVFEAICSPPAGAKIVGGRAREHCPISDHQFMVAAAEQVSIESVQEQVRALLDGRIVVGFDTSNNLKVLSISLPPEMVRDIQLHFNAQQYSELDLSGTELLKLNDAHRVHSLRNLVKCVLNKTGFQEGPHSALADTRATMELYLWDRGRIEGASMSHQLS